MAIIILSIGNGCEKPCILALGADQFQLPEQSKQAGQFFSKFYFVLKISGFLASLLTPVLRSDFPSLSPADGYLLSFSVTMSMNLVAFGKVYYLSNNTFNTCNTFV